MFEQKSLQCIPVILTITPTFKSRFLLNKNGHAMTDGDLLKGATEISEFLFGETVNCQTATKNRRFVYGLWEQQSVPLFKMGGKLCARRSTLDDWFQNQEVRASA